MKRQEATNTFQEGMVMDFNPLTTPNNVVTNCLNGTLLTFNGNEYVLQNDMGNGRVETAYLPEGYVPLGTAELGGIIYIVSYNPLIDKCQIGCFPSPERNITSDELQTPQISVSNEQFQQAGGKILNTILKVKLLSDPNSEDGVFKLNPGDKYTVYSTNNGVTKNKQFISDVGRTEHIVDIDPRTVTIHIVSIGEDGKIVYLDDSLKWTDASGNPAHYYIKECKQGNDINKDINEEYRSLVSSAYNIFNSKVSGELALLFELKVIDTFSATWDADVEDIEGVTKAQAESGVDNKKATIHFNINYTSDHKNINLEHVLLTGSAYAGTKQMWSDPNVMEPLHCTLGIDKGSRKNDGTDSDIATSVATFQYNSEGDLSDYIWNYALTPAMEFGYLDFLTLKGSINFLEIGSGKTELDEWRYFIQDNNFYLNWGLSAYPEKNKRIDKVTMTFIPFNQVNETNIITDVTNEYGDKYTQYVITGKSSYSGYFQELLPFGVVNSKVKNVELLPNSLYLVDICVDYGKDNEFEHRHNYRWLYTTKQWNDVFVHDSSVTDFSKQLTLDKVLNFGPEFDVNDKISIQTDQYNSQVTFPRIYDETTKTYGTDKLAQPYAVAGAQVTTVNYNKTNQTFNTNTSSIEVNVGIKCTSYPELFQFEKTSNDNYTFQLGETSIIHDDFNPKSDTKASSLATQVISKVAEQNETTKQISIEADLGATISTILDSGIKSETTDNKALDSFTAQLTSETTKFNINLIGAIFSRINADLQVKPVSIGQEIKPFLYMQDDYNSIGLESATAFTEPFTEWHGDHGGGNPFYFGFSSSGFSFESKKKNWNPTDKWTRQNWWDDIPPYIDYLNPQMLAAQGSFQVMYYKGGKGTTFRDRNIQGQYGLWARTSEGHYVPINCFYNTVDKLAGLVANLYAQLYYVDTDTLDKDLPVVTNINYLTGYTETWNVNVNVSLSISNILNNVNLLHSGGEMSLTTLQNNCKNLPIDLSNITANKVASLGPYAKTISHSFYLQNIDLYNQYDDNKATSIPAVALLSTEDSWERCSPKTQNNIYVQNKSASDVDFVKLNQITAKNITYGGSFSTSTVDGQTRLKLIPGTSSSYSNPIYSCFQLAGGVITLLQNKLLGKKYAMKFQTDSEGDPWSTVQNNSGYGLISTYEK